MRGRGKERVIFLRRVSLFISFSRESRALGAARSIGRERARRVRGRVNFKPTSHRRTDESTRMREKGAQTEEERERESIVSPSVISWNIKEIRSRQDDMFPKSTSTCTRERENSQRDTRGLVITYSRA